MKFIFTLLMGFLFFSANSQQWKVTSSYSLAMPKQEMGKNIQPAHSMQTGISYQLPGALKRLSVGLEFGIGIYAYESIDQTFQFDNNTSTILPVMSVILMLIASLVLLPETCNVKVEPDGLGNAFIASSVAAVASITMPDDVVVFAVVAALPPECI